MGLREGPAFSLNNWRKEMLSKAKELVEVGLADEAWDMGQEPVGYRRGMDRRRWQMKRLQ